MLQCLDWVVIRFRPVVLVLKRNKIKSRSYHPTKFYFFFLSEIKTDGRKWQFSQPALWKRTPAIREQKAFCVPFRLQDECDFSCSDAVPIIFIIIIRTCGLCSFLHEKADGSFYQIARKFITVNISKVNLLLCIYTMFRGINLIYIIVGRIELTVRVQCKVQILKIVFISFRKQNHATRYFFGSENLYYNCTRLCLQFNIKAYV